MFNVRRIRWALRKVSLPVRGDGLVLDVGSGGKPYPRSDVLVDRMSGEAHRSGGSMMIDRPCIMADASQLPFRAKVFDYVIASHVLEHIADPSSFFGEITRVGKAGYIETPNVIFERFIPYKIHCLEVISIDNTLHILKKSQALHDPFLGGLRLFERDQRWAKFFYEAPDMFHVRHFWNDNIKYQVHNPQESCEWIEAINAKSEQGTVTNNYRNAGRTGWREWGLTIFGMWHQYRRAKRLREFDLHSILACPKCKGDLEQVDVQLRCRECHIGYSARPYPDFTREFR